MTQVTKQSTDRRRDLLTTAVSAAGMLIVGCAATGTSRGGQSTRNEHEEAEAEVTPGEDLMQEHGVLERILLIYDEAARRIDQHEPLDGTVLVNAAGIVRRFVEDYHEKTEEQIVFPRLQKAARETTLIAILLRQHQRGREVTDDIVRRARSAPGPELTRALRGFTSMYRPHAAREDTVLFPAFREVVGRAGYRELGEQFEEHEHALFGEHGFENAVTEVAKLEAAFGIEDLARFTAP
jgi:hemerythrin-like domain-containing protein